MQLLLYAIVALVAAGGLSMLFGARSDVKGPQARQLVADGARLIDVRTPGEFQASHLPGAINLPVEALECRLKEVGPKDAVIVLYCASGARSAQAKRVLVQNGYATVHNLGPMGAW